MKRMALIALSLALLVASMTLTGCGKKDGADDEEQITVQVEDTTPTPGGATPDADGTGASPAPDGPGEGSEELSAVAEKTCAYYFADIGGAPMLYGAACIKNTGTGPMTVSEATFEFDVGGATVSKAMKPMLGQSDVIAPGASAEICLWTGYAEDVPLGAAVEVRVTFSAQSAEAAPRSNIALENLRALQNYPRFATVSGMVKNLSAAQDYSLVLIYLAFYDENDELLGVWHFTKDAQLRAEGKFDFVMHMQSLPIPGLAESCTRIEGRGIGIE